MTYPATLLNTEIFNLLDKCIDIPKIGFCTAILSFSDYFQEFYSVFSKYLNC